MAGLYIHIPFCKQACSYCDFYFVTRQQEKQHFVNSLIAEIMSRKGSRFAEEEIRTIYFGGGTPSLLTLKHFEKLFEAIRSVFVVNAEEITVELNPDDVTAEYLNGLKDLGVNRVSMGVQSFNEGLLRFMNRAHNAREALHCLELLKKSGIQVFTVDLIYGNPGQSLQELKEDLETLIRFAPPHVSAYSLTIEPATRLGKQLKLGRIAEPEDELVEQHIELVETLLKEAGIHRYEISNYARPGYEARHNSGYWNHENYLGLGPGAHSFWWAEDHKSALRWENKPDLKAYLNSPENRTKPETLTLNELAEERLMLGLRTREGISPKELSTRYQYNLNEAQLNYINKLVKTGRAKMGSSLKLTSEGLKIADAITLDLITI